MEGSLFGNAVVLGVPLLFVTIGLVQWSKKFGLKGKALNGVSMVVGLVLGMGFQISSLGLPADFGGWFGIIVYGLGLGLVASGIYDAAQDIARG